MQFGQKSVNVKKIKWKTEGRKDWRQRIPNEYETANKGKKKEKNTGELGKERW